MSVRPSLWASLACAVLLLFSARSEAQTCYEFRQGTSGSYYDSPDAACSAYASSATSGPTWPGGYNCSNDGSVGNFCTVTSIEAQPNGDWPTMRCRLEYQQVNKTENCTGSPLVCTIQTNSTNTRVATATLSSRSDPEGCPQCEAAGTRFSANVANMSSQDVGTVGCASGCEAKIAGPTRNIIGGKTGTLKVATVESTGRACQASSGASSAPNVSPGECGTDSGNQLCLDSGQNCGTVNGDRVCPKTIASGCVSYASGGVACVVSGPGAVPSTTPPLPNNGPSDPDTPAEPDATVEGAGKTINYYGGATVSASTNDPTDEAPGSVGGDPVEGGSGTGGGGTPGTGSAGTVNSDGEDTADGTCQGTECSGTGALLPDLAELDSFQAITQGYWNALQAAPIVAAVNSIGTSLPAASCPTWSSSIPYLDTTLTFDVHCDLFANIAPLLSAVMLAVWSIMGIVIILRA